MAVASENQKSIQPRGIEIEGCDLVLSVFLGALLGLKILVIEQIIFPLWDGAVYLLNARNLLSGTPLYEWFRPPVLPTITAGIWMFTGENFVVIKYIQIIFTLLSGVVFYIILKKDMGGPFALAGTILLMTTTQILLWSDHILVHGISLFFSIITLLLWREYTPRKWLLGGVTGALAFLSRYPTGIVIVAILFAYTVNHKKLLLVYSALVGLLLPLMPIYFYSPSLLIEVVSSIVSEYGRFGAETGALGVSGTRLFYLINSWNLFKVCAILVLPALLLKSTYTQTKNRVWLFWLGSSFIVYSVISNKQLRFTFEWTPAIIYLSMVTIMKVQSIVLKPHLDKTIISRLVIAVLLGTTTYVNTVFSVDEYLTTYENYVIPLKDPSILLVVDYIKDRTSQDEVIISEAQAPILALYSDRDVYTNDAKVIENLREFLEHGYDSAWNTTLFLSFPDIGRFTLQELDDQPYLQWEAKFELFGVLGDVHVYKINLGK